MRENLVGKTINDLIEKQKDSPPSIDIMGNVKAKIFNDPVTEPFKEYTFIEFLSDLITSMFKRG